MKNKMVQVEYLIIVKYIYIKKKPRLFLSFWSILCEKYIVYFLNLEFCTLDGYSTPTRPDTVLFPLIRLQQGGGFSFKIAWTWNNIKQRIICQSFVRYVYEVISINQTI